jgi:hypothetical protein
VGQVSQGMREQMDGGACALHANHAAMVRGGSSGAIGTAQERSCHRQSDQREPHPKDAARLFNAIKQCSCLGIVFGAFTVVCLVCTSSLGAACGSLVARVAPQLCGPARASDLHCLGQRGSHIPFATSD